MDEQFCQCINWARDVQKFFTQHHPNCPHYDPSGEAVEMIRALLRAMERWGAEEDGIPMDAWFAYTQAKEAIGEPPKSTDSVVNKLLLEAKIADPAFDTPEWRARMFEKMREKLQS